MVCVTALAVPTISLELEWEPFAPPLKLRSKATTGKELKTVAFGKPRLGHLPVRHMSTPAVAERYSRYQPTARYRLLRRRHARV